MSTWSGRACSRAAKSRSPCWPRFCSGTAGRIQSTDEGCRARCDHVPMSSDDRIIEPGGDDASAPQELDPAWIDFDPRVTPLPGPHSPREAQTVDEELIAADETSVVSEQT